MKKLAVIACLLASAAFAHGDDDGRKWRGGSSPSCPSPELFMSPVDLSTVGAAGGPAFTPAVFSVTLKASCGKVYFAFDGIPDWLQIVIPGIPVGYAQSVVDTQGITVTFNVTSAANSYPVGCVYRQMRVYNDSWTATPLPHAMALALNLAVLNPTGGC